MAGKKSKPSKPQTTTRKKSFTQAEVLELIDRREQESQAEAEEEQQPRLELTEEQMNLVTAHIVRATNELIQAFAVGKEEQIPQFFDFFMQHLQKKEPKVPCRADDTEGNTMVESDNDGSQASSPESIQTKLMRHGDELSKETPIKKAKSATVNVTPSSSTRTKRKNEGDHSSKNSTKKSKR